ncbi:patatin-like phospholipase family protein [Novosphingobium sp. AP12]|uniref:patatin-like phospholipase family protein n=1 Tax=Novosphingobium sp. AP12 TaxID=1144305 RepID=UPI000271E1D7|nr:patatin-like phospholipase family protein [Novosphingobium sp. AP12]EJL35383.1 putative esterase of the alpha-beta hydrolase superfamily [Novosphingobium sp. AP12]
MTWKAAKAVEKAQIRLWRERYGPETGRTKQSPEVGLALSGGGIRSATFNLGLLRALGQAGRIPFIDYVSTVSGGGYVGAFLCSMYVETQDRGEDPQPGVDVYIRPGVDPFTGKVGERALNHLRQSGRHLLPGGAGDAVEVFAITLRNLFGLHLVIGSSLLAIFMVFKSLKAWLMSLHWLKELEAKHLAANYPPSFWPTQWLQGLPIGHYVVASGLWMLAGLGAIICAGLGAAHFITRRTVRPPMGRWFRIFSLPGGLVAGVIVLSLILMQYGAPPVWPYALFSGVVGIFAIVAYLIAQAVDWYRPPVISAARGKAALQEDRVRKILSDCLGAVTMWTLVICVAATLDSVAQIIYIRLEELLSLSLGAITSIGLLSFLARTALKGLAGTGGKSRVGEYFAKFGRLIALVLGLLIASIIGVAWAVAAHVLAWRGNNVGDLSAWGEYGLCVLSGVAIALVIAAWILGKCWGFVNLSSFSAFYSSRLRRAYLGASNQNRKPEQPVNAQNDDDEITISNYYKAGVQAPVHLINITINDTTGGSSNLTRTDRRGMPLVVSPAGVLYPKVDAGEAPSLIDHSNDGDGAQALPLSVWTAISGAAFSTGIGQHGSLGLSLLAGIANLRLGYWWDSGLKSGLLRGPIFPMQWHLFEELTGRFGGTNSLKKRRVGLRRQWQEQCSRWSGYRKLWTGMRTTQPSWWRRVTNLFRHRRQVIDRWKRWKYEYEASDTRRWHLSDGGHFENLGVYELVRRRVDFIIASDCGADPRYQMSDLTRMMRMIRTDLGANLRFFDEDKLSSIFGKKSALRHCFTPISGMIGKPWDRETSAFGPYAALGEITYDDDPSKRSTFLLIKPRLAGCEYPDVLAFARKHGDYPQQTTADQFFNEEQWDAYYRLGHHIGERIFAASSKTRMVGRQKWEPHMMHPYY